jgi:putative ABC transport system substrate-binding protein
MIEESKSCGEQPTKFEFIVNLKAAKQIGLTIPHKVLAKADRVIK